MPSLRPGGGLGMGQRVKRQRDGGNGASDGGRTGAVEVRAGRRPWDAGSRTLAQPDGLAGLEEISPFPPIADYGFLSDCEVTALIAPSGNVEWMCLPRMDSPSVFGALLDRGAGS